MAGRTKDPSQCALDLDAPVRPRAEAETAVGTAIRALAESVALPVPPSVHHRPRSRGGRRDFVVGRLTRKTREVRILDGRAAPIRGPWSLHAMVRGTGPSLRIV